MELQVGVKILLKNSEGKYLLVRRNPEKYPEVGAKWDIVGGRIIAGTSLFDNLRREIKEEVGLNYLGEPRLVSAQDIFVHRYTDAADNADIKNKSSAKQIERHVVRLTYIGEIDGNPVIDDDHLEARWFTGEEIKKLEPLDGYFRELVEREAIAF